MPVITPTKAPAPLLVAPPFDDDFPVYPAVFVVPDRAPYNYTVDMGVVRSEFAAGNTRQRRLYQTMPHYLTLVFHMRFEELFLWQTWVNEFAYSFFHCPVSTMYAGQPPTAANLRFEILRFTSNLDITADGWNWIAVTVGAELSNDAHATAPPVGLGGWIVGGQPDVPSSAAWFIAGNPAAPSDANTALAGTPAFPSSY